MNEGSMKSGFQFLIVLSVSVALRCSTFSAEILTQQPPEGPHTAVTLLADVRSIAPGSQFTIGIRMRMEEGWHTYWKYAGEAGLPTQVSWKLPAGISAGAIQWPLPHKYVEGGEIVTFGYAHENMLMVPMTAAADLKPGTMLTLHANVSWLECKNVCIPGKASVEVRLPVSDKPPVPSNESLFQTYRQKVPPPPGQESGIHVGWGLSKGIVRVIVHDAGISPGDTTTFPDLYPEAIEDVEIGRTRTQAFQDSAIIVLPLSSYDKVVGARTLHGIVVRPSLQKAFRVEVPLDAQFCASLPNAGAAGNDDVLDRPFETVQGSGLSLWMYLLFAVIGGLLLNIMPCVLPVIALKIFGLVGMAGDQPKRIRSLGFMFSLGILTSFLALALLVILLQTAGQQVGWGFQFQEPAFVVAMSALVFAFGLSLFGVFEITLPGAAVSGLGNVLNEPERKSGSASFLEGVFATVLATPCTAPFLGTALGFAFAQPPWIILLIFTAVAGGMALPYLVLTSRPAWTRFLPKPGAWMEKTKQFMGFLMMATLLWLLYVLGKQLGMEAIIWTSGFLLMVGIACWIIGSFATLHATRGKYIVAWIVALAFVGAGYWIFLDDLFAAGHVLDGGTEVAAEKIQWRPYSRDQLESSLKGDRTVFIDFTADWCLTCKVNEKSVLTDRAVVDKFKSLDVVAFKADWTSRNAEITALLAKFGRSGVPLYVIFPPAERSRPIVLPEVITTGVVIDALDHAAQTARNVSRAGSSGGYGVTGKRED
jgi:thiol:disulfide interchange protein/DsbC/DsbD-like thiol-disulfide interchange protein